MGAPHILLSDVWDVKFWSCGDQQTAGAPHILLSDVWDVKF